MPRTRELKIYVLVLFCVFFSSRLYAAQCTMPTIPGKVVFPSNWHGKPKIYTEKETVEQNDSVYTWVVSTGWPCPPYTWSINGEEFELERGATNSDYELNRLKASAWACGSATITVTDSRGEEATGYVRCTTGQWIYVGSKGAKSIYGGWCTGNSNCSKDAIVSGKYKWDNWGESCRGSIGTDSSYWVNTGGYGEVLDPPCGSPWGCREEDHCGCQRRWGNYCGPLNSCNCYPAQFKFYVWSCP